MRVAVEEVCVLKQRGDLIGQQLAPDLLALLLDDLGEGDLEAAREIKLELGVHNESASSLSRLRVDTDDSLVVAADISGVQGQVGHAVPGVLVAQTLGLAVLETLLDGILVAA